jgi:hypothetical protein
MAAYSSSLSKRTGKMNLQPVLNNSSRVHMELEFDMLGVAGKLVKYVVYWSKRNSKNKISS